MYFLKEVWTLPILQQDFIAKHIDHLPNLVNASDPQKYKDYLVKVEIYFESFEYESIVEVPSYRVRTPATALTRTGYVLRRRCFLIQRTYSNVRAAKTRTMSA